MADVDWDYDVDVIDIEYDSAGTFLLIGLLKDEEYSYFINPPFPLRIHATVAHYGISDMEYLRERGHTVEIDHDTLVLSVINRPDLFDYSLKSLSGYPDYPDLSKEIDRFVRASFLAPVIKYNENDCRATWLLFKRLKHLTAGGPPARAEGFLNRVSRLLFLASKQGVLVRGVERVKEQYRARYRELESELKGLSISPRILRSTKKLLEQLKSRDGNLEATGEEELISSSLPEELVNKILEARSVFRIEKCLPETDGVVRTSYLLHGVSSGRIRSKNPNLQNIPKEVRHVFVPREGNIFVELDYVAAELFSASLIAHRLGAPVANILARYRRGEDLHRFMAERISNGEVTPEMRQGAKAVNFGFLYGMGPQKFVVYAKQNFGVEYTQSEASRLRNLYFETYPEIKFLHRRISGGIRTTPFGRFLPEKNGLRFRVSAVVSSFASDCLLAGALEVHRLLGLVPVLLVHDSVVYEVENHPHTITLVSDLIKQVFPAPPVPFPPGWSWGEDRFRYTFELKKNWKEPL